MNLKNKFISIIKSNQRTTRGFRYTIPAPLFYPNQWLWDSCFHSIIYLALNKINYAKDEIRALLSAQWKNGLVSFN